MFCVETRQRRIDVEATFQCNVEKSDLHVALSDFALITSANWVYLQVLADEPVLWRNKFVLRCDNEYIIFLQVTGNPQPSSQVVLSSGFHIVDETPNPLNGIDEMIVILQNKRTKTVKTSSVKTLRNVLSGSMTGIKRRVR